MVAIKAEGLITELDDKEGDLSVITTTEKKVKKRKVKERNADYYHLPSPIAAPEMWGNSASSQAGSTVWSSLWSIAAESQVFQ